MGRLSVQLPMNIFLFVVVSGSFALLLPDTMLVCITDFSVDSLYSHVPMDPCTCSEIGFAPY